VQKKVAEEESVQKAALELLVRKKTIGSTKGIEQIAAEYDIIGGSGGELLVVHTCMHATQHNTHTVFLVM